MTVHLNDPLGLDPAAPVRNVTYTASSNEDSDKRNQENADAAGKAIDASNEEEKKKAKEEGRDPNLVSDETKNFITAWLKKGFKGVTVPIAEVAWDWNKESTGVKYRIVIRFHMCVMPGDAGDPLKKHEKKHQEEEEKAADEWNKKQEYEKTRDEKEAEEKAKKKEADAKGEIKKADDRVDEPNGHM